MITAPAVIQQRHPGAHGQDRYAQKGHIDARSGRAPVHRGDLQPARTDLGHRTSSFSHTAATRARSDAIPATTATAPQPPRPIFSRPPIASTTVAITTLDSRTAATDAAGASRNAASVRA